MIEVYVDSIRRQVAVLLTPPSSETPRPDAPSDETKDEGKQPPAE